MIIKKLTEPVKELFESLFPETKKIIHFSPQPWEIAIASIYNISAHAKSEIITIFKDAKFIKEIEINDEDRSIIENHYADIIDFCFCNYFNHLPSNKTLPQSLLELCCFIWDDLSTTSIYFQYNGYGELAYTLGKSNSGLVIDGIEKDRIIRAFSTVLLDSFNIKNRIKEYKDYVKTYKYIFVHFPFYNNSESLGINYIKELREIIDSSLEDNGEMMCLLPSSLFTTNHDLKELLSDKEYPLLIISLPSTEDNVEELWLMYLQKKVNDENILLIDAHNDFMAKKKMGEYGYSWCLKLESLKETISLEDCNYCWRGTYKELKDSFNLDPTKYVSDYERYEERPKADEETYSLKDLIELIKITDNKTNPIEFIEPSELLSDASLDYSIAVNYNHTKNNCKAINESCLLLSASIDKNFSHSNIHVGKLLKNSLTGISGNIIPLKIISNKISEDYLIKWFLSDDFKKQTTSRYARPVNYILKGVDLLSLKINLPSIEKQEDICRREILYIRHREVFKHFGDGKFINDKNAEDILIKMLDAIYWPNKYSKSVLSANNIRKMLEALFEALIKNNIIPVELENNINPCKKYLSGEVAKPQLSSNYFKARINFFGTKETKDKFCNTVEFSQQGSHHNNGSQTSVIFDEEYFGYVMNICSAIVWFGRNYLSFSQNNQVWDVFEGINEQDLNNSIFNRGNLNLRVGEREHFNSNKIKMSILNNTIANIDSSDNIIGITAGNTKIKARAVVIPNRRPFYKEWQINLFVN